MGGRLLDGDAEARRDTLFHAEPDGDVSVEARQDVEPVIELARAEHNAGAGRWNDLNKVASIPAVVYEDLVRRGITRDQKAFRRWLDDPDNRAFRTRPGRLSK